MQITKLYDFLTNDGYKPPHRRSSTSILQHSQIDSVVSQTGEVSENFVTGICFQSSQASKLLSEGINPITGDKISNYQELSQNYFPYLPDSISVISDQFRLSNLDNGKMVLIIEDKEWPIKIMQQLENAGINYQDEEVVEDVRKHYNRLCIMFQRYVKEVLHNKIDIEVLKTSKTYNSIDKFIQEKDITSLDADKRRIYFLSSPYMSEYLVKEHQYSSITRTDPIRFFEESLHSKTQNITNPIKRRIRKYYETTENTHETLIFPQTLSPQHKGSKFDFRTHPKYSVNPYNWKKLLEKNKNPENSNLKQNSILRLSTAFPKTQKHAKQIIKTQKEISEKRCHFKNKGKEKGLTGRDLGDYVDLKRREIIHEDHYKKLYSSTKKQLETLY